MIVEQLVPPLGAVELDSVFDGLRRNRAPSEPGNSVRIECAMMGAISCVEEHAWRNVRMSLSALS